MRALFVTPVERGAGETVTAAHMADNVERRGGAVQLLASPFAAKLVGERFRARVHELTSDSSRNRGIWDATVASFRPDVIVFADYPLLFFTTGVSPLASAGWEEELARADACLVTLDHTGFAQRRTEIFFGPPHLSLHYEALPAPPERMHILLPCPMHEPSPLPWRKGHPFRYWRLPLTLPSERRSEVRKRYAVQGDDLLIFHSVPTWAWTAAQAHGLPYFSFLPELLEHHLGVLAPRVVLASVNNGSLLPRRSGAALRIVNLPVLRVEEYEELMFASDLMITENKISISLGKAVCGLHPCAAFKNSQTLRELLARLDGRLREIVLAMERLKLGSVFPYEVFPSGMREELEQLALYRDNSLTRCFAELELFGGDSTGERLRGLLVEEEPRALLRDEQERYVERVRSLDDAHDALARLLATG
jgi:hypothetical protein